MGGNGLAQMIVLLASPILTRLYSPEDFGLLGLYVSFLAILATLGSLQYDKTIYLPKDNLEGANLVGLSFLLLSVITCALSLTFFLFKEELTKLFQIQNLNTYIYLLPISLFGICGYQILANWAFRQKNYLIVSKTKLTQSIGMVITQIIGGLFFKGPLPLFLGDIIGRVGGSGRLFVSTIKQDKLVFKRISLTAMKTMAVRYKNFPLISSASSFIRQVSLELPIILLTIYYGPSVGGWFLIIQRILGTPLQLIGFSVGSVFFAEASTLIHTNPNQVNRLFMKTIKNLALVILPLLSIVSVLAPWLLPIVFGAEWAPAGHHLPILSVMYFFQFLSIPVGSTVLFLERHDLQFLRECLRIIFIASAFFYAQTAAMSPTGAIVAVSIAGACGFIIHGLLSWLALKQFLSKKRKQIS